MEDLRLTRERWSWEENKMFEMALSVVEEQHPHRWEAVAAMIGGHKTSDEVRKHYNTLLKDLQLIHSGIFDHQFSAQSLYGPCTSTTQQDNNFLVESCVTSKAMILRSRKQLDDSNVVRSGPQGFRCRRATHQVNCKL